MHHSSTRLDGSRFGDESGPVHEASPVRLPPPACPSASPSAETRRGALRQMVASTVSSAALSSFRPGSAGAADGTS